MDILDGKIIATKTYDRLKKDLASLSFTPKLSIIIVGHDVGSEMYVKMKSKKAGELGIESEIFAFEENASPDKIISCIQNQNNDKNVAGILVQLPLPKNYHKEILEFIDPKKDVDCLTSTNMGLLALNQPRFYPATVQAVLTCLENINLSGKIVTVIGQSDMVGLPTAIAAIIKDATVISCNSKTPSLSSLTKIADVIISATGKPHLITSDMIKKDCVLIDCGISKNSDGQVIGDIDFESTKELASAITPVPGGIGPLTISSLLDNVVKSCHYLST